jgi:hypothetical protein
MRTCTHAFAPSLHARERPRTHAHLPSPSYDSEVKEDENAMWYSMFEWSKEKADAWLQRTDGRFNFKVEEQMSKRKKAQPVESGGPVP